MDHPWKKFLFSALPWVWTVFIWSNSLRPASQSSVQSLSVLGMLNPLVQLLPDFLAAQAHYILRKLAHAFEFAVLGTLWYISLSAVPRSNIRRLLTAAAISAGTAVLDESIQLFRPGRSGQLSDICLDTVSALLAILLCAGIRHLWNARRRADRLP